MLKFPFILITAILLLFCSCNSDSNVVPTPVPDDSLDLINAFPNLGFSRPLDFQSPSDGTDRAFVVEQGGSIRVFQNEASVSEVSEFLNIGDRIVSSDELGLLGLAFHPDYENNGFFFVTYTPSENLAVVSRFKVSDTDVNMADPGSETVLMRIPQPFTNHNGGQLAFGPDGYLYIASGDGGSGGDPDGNAQNLGNLLGKILRIDIDNTDDGLEYAVPNDNPFINTANARGEIYAYGLRNPWRFSFDVQTNNIWAGDVGQNKLEEIDIIEKGGNYGWNILEGTSCFGSDSCDSSGTIAPVFEYGHEANDRSVTGGHVYRGTLVPSLKGLYIYGDFISGRIWALTTDLNNTLDNQLLLDTNINISSFGTDNNNEIYICGFDGKIYRFEEISN
ncbi:PQQ-dependent sugar dehydrogenase [Maribacter sp. 2304DJ31-5]|uniref:PQQ-dependent sugar dehydrogenase n=1 Tax=Maribacter sp. 2304DJ31-5 TaxID=3386273 RepID=UPI0039BD2F30